MKSVHSNEEEINFIFLDYNCPPKLGELIGGVYLSVQFKMINILLLQKPINLKTKYFKMIILTIKSSMLYY